MANAQSYLQKMDIILQKTTHYKPFRCCLIDFQITHYYLSFYSTFIIYPLPKYTSRWNPGAVLSQLPLTTMPVGTILCFIPARTAMVSISGTSFPETEFCHLFILHSHERIKKQKWIRYMNVLLNCFVFLKPKIIITEKKSLEYQYPLLISDVLYCLYATQNKIIISPQNAIVQRLIIILLSYNKQMIFYNYFPFYQK